MSDEKKTISEMNHRIAIRNTINCILGILLASIILILITTFIGFSISGSNSSDVDWEAAIGVGAAIWIIYIGVVIYLICKAIKKNNEATKFDRVKK